MEISEHVGQLADSLVKNGVKYAFGLAGGGMSLQLITALESKGVKFFPVAHEASAALMAGACCYDGKTRAVAITIKGPGFANLIPGILSNFYEDRPAITISEAYSPNTPSFKKHKRLDHKIIYPEILKDFMAADGEIGSVEKLIKKAEQEIPGPVHIDLYGEAAESSFAEASDDKQNVEIKELQKEGDLDEVLNLIKKYNRPVVVLGSMVLRRLKNIKWEEVGVPVVTTAAAKGAIDENSSFAGGIITGEVKELSPEEAIIKQADVVVSFGLRNTEVVSANKYDAPFINIDISNFGLSEGFSPDIEYFAGDSIEEDAIKVISLLKEKKWGEDVVSARNRALEEDLFQNPWLPASIFKKIQDKFNDAVLVLDTGLFCIIGETVWKAKTPENFIGSSVGRFMGTGIPTAIGFAIATQKTTICVAGDGGIRPYLSEIKLAVEKKLPILFVLMSDDGYGTISIGGIKKELSENAYKINNSSWHEAVEKMGCASQRIENKEDLEKSLNDWQFQEGPMFLEMHFEPDEYREMVKNIR